MTDQTMTTSDEPKAGSAHMAGYLAGPVYFAIKQFWGAFWGFVALDLLALTLCLQDNLAAGLAVLLVGRGLLLAFGKKLFANAEKQRLHQQQGDSSLMGLPIVGMLAYLVSLIAVVQAYSGTNFGAMVEEFPKSRALHKSVSRSIDNLIELMTVNLDPFFQVIKTILLTLLTVLEASLDALPWPVFFALVGFLAWKRGGWRVLALVWGALFYLGIFGFWDKAITTAALVVAALIVCLVVGVPLGVVAAKSKLTKTIVEPVLDFMQTLPSFVYLLPAVAFFSIGKPPALIATVVFALPPLVRLTILGIEQVPSYVREAMFAHGATPMQTLVKAELPLALPSIQAGINQCIMMSLSMVVIASLIGGAGLGYDVLFALQNVQHGKGLLAGIAIVACAMMFDRLVRSNKTQGSR